MTSTTQEHNPNIILKTDRRGRVRTPAAQRQQLLDAFAHSGMSAAEFAAQAGVKYPTFAAWVQKRRRAQSAAEPKALQWAEAVVAPLAARAGALRLHLPGGAWLEIGDEAQAALACRVARLWSAGC